MTRPRPGDVLKVLGSAAVIAVAAFAVSRVFEIASTDRVNFLLWLLAGAVLHDLVLLPLYVLADLVARVAVADHPLRRVRVVNHLRFPAAISLVLLLVYFPSILGRNDANFARVSGRPQATDPLEAWLWITAAAFVVSALVLAVRVLRTGRARASRSASGDPGTA